MTEIQVFVLVLLVVAGVLAGYLAMHRGRDVT